MTHLKYLGYLALTIAVLLDLYAGNPDGDALWRIALDITALMLAVSGTCSLVIGLTFGGPTWLVVIIGLVWGLTVVADSAQFSAMVTEVGDQAYVGTALTMQIAIGFTISAATIWIVPVVVDAVSWRWAFATLAVLSFLANWNDFLWPVYVLFSAENLTLPPGLSILQGAYTTNYPVIMAGAVLASVPVLILFFFTQRWVIEGVAQNGLKG